MFAPVKIYARKEATYLNWEVNGNHKDIHGWRTYWLTAHMCSEQITEVLNSEGVNEVVILTYAGANKQREAEDNTSVKPSMARMTAMINHKPDSLPTAQKAEKALEDFALAQKLGPYLALRPVPATPSIVYLRRSKVWIQSQHKWTISSWEIISEEEVLAFIRAGYTATSELEEIL